MAENKKGVLVYADWIDKFEELEDDEAGRLIKHFFRYVNDLDPEYPDRTTKLMFIDIKNTLKRDLDKWEDKSPQRIEKARLAGLASAKARELKKQLESTNELEVELNPTKSTVSVSVSDTVSESVKGIKVITNDINTRKLKFAQSLIPFVSIYGSDLIRNFCDYWSEPNKSNTKFRQELEKTWDASRRLKTWNENNFSKSVNNKKQTQDELTRITNEIRERHNQ